MRTMLGLGQLAADDRDLVRAAREAAAHAYAP